MDRTSSSVGNAVVDERVDAHDDAKRCYQGADAIRKYEVTGTVLVYIPLLSIDHIYKRLILSSVNCQI